MMKNPMKIEGFGDVGKTSLAERRKTELVLYPDSAPLTPCDLPRQLQTRKAIPMTNTTPTFLAQSADAFAQPIIPSLADVRERIKSDESINSRRRGDLLSALNRFEKASGKVATEIEATPTVVRRIFANLTIAHFKLTSRKTFANIRALVIDAVRQYGAKVMQLTKRIPIAPRWQELLVRVKPDYVRQGLYRLAAFCTVMGVSPHEVSSEILLGLHTALEAEELVKRPRSILKITITSWNRGSRTIEGWPQIVLSSPFKRTSSTIPLDKFPLEFQEEIKEWARKLLKPDILDNMGVGGAVLRQTTVDHRILQIQQFASALINSGKLAIEDVTSLSVLFKPEVFTSGVRCFLKRHDGKSTTRIYHLANNLRLIAKHHCRFDEKALKTLSQTCKALDPKNRHQMTPKNEERLQQFDSPRNVSLLLCFPKEQADTAVEDKNKPRGAKLLELAIAVDLLLHTGLRSRTLRMLEMKDFDFDLDLKDGAILLRISPEKTKTNRKLEFELLAETADRLKKFIKDYRLLLPGFRGPYLFPGIDGGYRSKNAMYELVRGGLKKHTGLIVNPHLMRHVIAKIAIEQDPDAYASVSRVLGHTSMNTTMAHYLGTETKSAGRHLDRLLDEAKKNAANKPSKMNKKLTKGGRNA